MGSKMMFSLYVCTAIMFEVVVAVQIQVIYKLTSGVVQYDIIPYLATKCANSNVVGVRKLENVDNHEVLDHTWMEQRSYDSGYSYYEKVVMIDEFDEQPLKESFWIIPGPMYAGSKITITLELVEENFVNAVLDLVDERFIPFSNILHQLAIRDDVDGVRITMNYQVGSLWQSNGNLYYSDFASVSGQLQLVLEILSDSLYATVNGGFPSYINMPPPGDIKTRILLRWDGSVPFFYSIKYEQ